MDARTVIDTLNAARARELAVIIQYMEHHYVAAGTVGLPSFVRQSKGDMWVSGHGTGLAAKLVGAPDAVVTLKAVAKAEMFHAQSFGRRVTALGGVPTVTPGERCKASTIRQMLEFDVAAEEEAVTTYAEAIGVCRGAGDDESRELFERILLDERAHLAAFRNLLGKAES